MWEAIKLFFGFGTLKNVETTPETTKHRKVVTVQLAPAPMQKPRYNINNVKRSEYYRRGGEYYRMDDDSIIRDTALIAVLIDMFLQEDDLDYIEANYTVEDAVAASMVYDSDEIAISIPENTVDYIDPAVEAVVRTIQETETAE